MQKFPESKHKEFKIFKKLNSPRRIQDFVDKIQINFEEGGETCLSPLAVLKQKKAHCLEGAMLASAIFWYHGEKPLLLDLKTAYNDEDHVVALFKEKGFWGAVSKTNHAVLRYRDPVYKTVRELAMSYFNEYFLDSGVKTLRSYSAPFNLSQYKTDWPVSDKNLWGISEALDKSPHFKILKRGMLSGLRKADQVEIKSGKLVQWKKKSR